MSLHIKQYQVDAFTDRLFAGNPAAVCPLDQWLPDEVMQNIALENNLAETAFYVYEKEGLRIRWFTPTVEVDLCGHATLATAFVLFYHENYVGDEIIFNSRSGFLSVTKEKELLSLNFPADIIKEVSSVPELENGMKYPSLKTFRGKTDYMLVYESEEIIKKLIPDFKLISKVTARGIIATAVGNEVDFVSRFFGPQSGIDEDPVTGSAHTTLTPYWVSILGKDQLQAAQLSKRGGKLQCTLRGDRVVISGRGKLFSAGTIFLE